MPTLAVLALLMVAGCGSAHSTTTPPPSKAQFIARADAVCQREEARLAKIRRRDRSGGHGITAAQLMGKEVVIDLVATARLEALVEPREEHARIGQWLTARIVASTVAHDAAEAPVGEDQIAVRDVLGELNKADAHAQSLARDYGLRVCSEVE